MLSSGIEKLDELLGGGVDFGKIVLIETVVGIGDIIALNFVADALRKDIKTFIILGRKRVKDVEEFLRKREVDRSNLVVVTTSEKGDKRLNLDELFLISRTIKDLAQRSKFGYIDILQILLILYDPRKIYSLFSDIISTLKDSEVMTVLTIDKRFTDERTLAMFEDLADVVIEIEEVVESLKVKRGIRIKKNCLLPPTDFYSLKIDKNGFRIED